MNKFQLYCSCIDCGVKTTAQNINGHWRSKHTVKGACAQCNKNLFNNNKFCSKSCSATYNNYLRSKTYKCKQCGKDSDYTHQKNNIYCSLECSSLGQVDKTLERFYSGQVAERATIRKILSKLRGYECECCGLSDWQGKKITLQVDHVDGNAGNNMPSNLRLICPNCHSQTDSFGGGNKGSGRAARGLPLH